jgi:UDP-N-acetylglucosamine 4,6-dehydratase
MNLVIGGTGTLGEAFIRKLLKEGHTSVTCFSRCELKQKELKARINNPRLKFILGDIRDAESIQCAVQGHKNVFHFAALKHVDTLEEFPEEAYKTNVQGTVNVLNAVSRSEVENYVFSSTDKAVDPINSYGFSKALAEKIIQARAKADQKRRYIQYRWGNVLGSRGSVLPVFKKKLLDGSMLPVTDERMTRFWIKIEEAVDFVFSTYNVADSGSTLVPPIKSASVLEVISSLAEILDVNGFVTEDVGIRPGEKIHERMHSVHSLEPDSGHSNYRFKPDELTAYLRGAL